MSMIRIVGSNPVAQSQVKGPVASTANKIVSNFEQLFNEVNQDQLNADQQIREVVSGRSKDIPAAMVSMEKAETSLKMLMAVRNKMVTAYEEIQRMQI
jgi:flagellar hook-basal body complex protein FliE